MGRGLPGPPPPYMTLGFGIPGHPGHPVMGMPGMGLLPPGGVVHHMHAPGGMPMIMPNPMVRLLHRQQNIPKNLSPRTLASRVHSSTSPLTLHLSHVHPCGDDISTAPRE